MNRYYIRPYKTIIENKNRRLYFKLKCSVGSRVAVAGTQHVKFQTINETYYIKGQNVIFYLPRINIIYNYHKKNNPNYSMDDLLSHVFSHEHIHNLILNNVGLYESSRFDKVKGMYDLSNKIRTGLPMGDDNEI